MKNLKPSSSRSNRLRALVAVAACQIGCLSTALAQSTFTWDGGDGSSPLWSTPGNWNPDGAPANGFTANFNFGGVVNTGSAGTPLNNDLTGGSITNLTFDAGAGAFYLAGNAITNWTGITNNSGGAQVINFGIVLSTNNPTHQTPHWINVGAGIITNGGTFAPSAGNSSLAKIGPGTLVFNSPLTNALGNGTPGGTPFVPGFAADSGTVIFDGGPTSLYNIPGEVTFGRAAPTGNTNVTVILNSGTFASTTWIAIGRGNGVGDVSADLILNGSSVLRPVNWSGCFNAGDGTRRPRGAVVHNGTSLFFINNNNNNNNFAESAGSFLTHTVNDSATLQVGSGAEGSVARARVGIAGRSVIKQTSATAIVTFGQSHFGDAAGGAGAFYNRGVFNLRSPASTDHFSIGSASGGATPANNGYGYYLNDTATVVGLKEIGVGGAGSGDGVLEVKQGNVYVTNWITMCRGTSTTAGAQQNSLLMIRNGTIFGPNFNQNYMLQSGSGISQYSVLDIGAGGKLGSQGTVHAMNLANANNALSFGTVTLSGGGQIEINRIFAGQVGPLTCVNFNNGTLKAMVDSAIFLGNNLDGVYVHAGGVTIDSAGFNISTVPMLQAPADFGITSIPVATPGVGYLGRPIVRITDPSGIGATAIAEWNEASGTITGVTITCPGSGYSSPTVTLVGGGFTNAATLGAPVLGSVASGGLTKTGAGTLTLLGGASYTGATVVNGGNIALNPAALFNSSGLTIAGAGLNVDVTSVASLSLVNLTLQNNATNSISYGNVFANPSVAAITVSGTLSAPGSGIVINIDGFGLQTGTFPLIDYNGTPLASIANFSLGTLPPGVVATLVNNTGNTSVDINITSSGQNLTWAGLDASTSLINPNWDIATATNWVLFGTATPARYQEYTTTTTVGDPVLFDDTLFNDFINPQPTNINLTTTVRPFKVTVDSTLPYSLTGAGGLTGAGSVIKSNAGSLFLGTSNSYTGGTFIYGGTVVVTNDSGLGGSNATVTLASGSLQIGNSIITPTNRTFNMIADSPLNVAAGATARIGGRFTGGARALFRDTGTAIITNATSLQFHVSQGTVIFDGNARITNTTSFSAVGPGSTTAENANLIIRSNATFDINQDFNIADTIDARGQLDIQNSAVIRAGSFFVGKFNTTTGLVYQTGGTFTNVSGGADWRIGGQDTLAAGSFGGYYLSGGRLDVQRNFQIGAFGTGEMIVSGGTWNQWGSFPVIGRFTNGVGSLTVSGGQFNQLATGNFLILGENGTGTMTIGGSGVVTLTNSLRLGGPGGNGTLNLNTGGKLVTPGIQLMADGVATLNLNGGTLQAMASSTAFLNGLSAANVLVGGVIFDTSSNNITVGQALLNAGGGGLMKNGTGVLTLTGASTYSGPTVVNAGRLLLGAAHQTSGTVTVADGAGFGAYVSGAGAAGVGNVTLGAAGATTLDVVLTTGNNPTAPVLQTGTLTVNGTATVRVLGKISLGTFPLLQYSGALGGAGTLNPVVAGPQGMVASLSNHVAGSTLYVTVTSMGTGIVWTGTNSAPTLANVWNLNAATNWLVGSTPTYYQEIIPPGDAVTFNNTGISVVLLSNVASPASVTFDNNINYSLLGPGRISGTTGLVKSNTGTAFISVAGNDYTGDTTVAGGTLRLGSATTIPDGASAGTLNIVAGQVDLNGFSETLNGLSGTGNIGNSAAGVATLTVGNGGKVANWGGTLDSTAGILLTKVGTNSLTITGNNTFRNGNSVVNGGTTIIGAGGTVINTTGEFWVANGANTIATNIIDGGTLVMSNNWLAVGRGVNTANGTLIINSGTVQKAGNVNAHIVVGSLAATGTLIVNGGQVLNNSMLWLGENTGANASLYLNGGLIQAAQVRPNGTAPTLSVAYFNGGILQATASSADFIQSGAFIQSGGLKLDSGPFDLTLASQVLQEDGSSPGGGLIKLGSGSLTLTVGGNYSGATIVSNGTLRVDGNLPGAVTVKPGATLGGIGSVNGVVTVEAGGRLGAGASIGTFVLSSTPVLNGSVVAEVDRNSGSPLADLISVASPITYGGNLMLTNTGTPLEAGDTFTLFNAPGYGGSFSIVSQTPGQVVTWNTANLTVDGTISVATVGPLTPPTMTNSVSGNTLTLTWPPTYLGWILQMQTNSLSTGIANNWVDVPGSGGSTSATVTTDPANPTVFIRLRSP